MSRLPPLFCWLTFAALADWLITRTLTRTAIFMPKSPPLITIYQLLAFTGQLAATLAGLLALAAVGWMAWHGWRTHGARALPAVLLCLAALSLAFLFVPAAGWLAVLYHLLVIAAAGLIAGTRRSDPSAVAPGSVVLLPALALAGGSLYQSGPALYSALRWPGPPPFTAAIFNAGELFAVLSPIGLWWAYGRGAPRLAWLWGAFPAAAFAVMHLVNPAMTGIIAIWSTGLTLYLPWPLYAVSLWLAGVTVIATLRRDEPAGWAILLLAAGGYAPQLSTQVIAGLIGLWLLALRPGHPEKPVTYIKRVERVALAVEDLDTAQAFFEQWFGAKFHPEENIEDMGIRYRPFDIGDSKMELLMATREDSPVAKFIQRNGGPGVHHITYEVDDLDAAIAELERRGGRIAYRHTYQPGVTFEGQVWREAFIHPKDAFGVLIHLAEKKPVTSAPRRGLEMTSLALLAAYAAMTAYFVAAPRLGWPNAIWLMHVSPFAFFGFALSHAGLSLSWRNALAFWGVSFVVSLAFESVGVLTGWPFGAYHYSHILGWKIFGLVPAIIPVAWFMMMYASHCLVNVIAGASTRARASGPQPVSAVGLAFVSAAAMTAWDLSLDPEMVRRGAWVWESPGQYFGIPLSNYAGWLLTTFIVFLLYRLYALRRPARPPVAGWFAHLPVAAYAVAWLGEVTSNLLNLEPAIGLISFFAMGSFVFVALLRMGYSR